MSNIIQPLIDFLKSLAEIMPLEWFTFLGAFIEELIAPIPSPLVMTLAGSIASAEKATILFLFIISLTGALGKTIGSYLIYLISNKAEHLIVGKFGKFIGVTEKEIDVISKKLNGGWKDYLVIFLLRAIPIMPTAPVSVVCGLIALDLKAYLSASFVGTIVRNIFYIYLGFTSLNAIESINEDISAFEKFGYIILLILMFFIFLIIYRQKKKGSAMSILEKSEKDKKTDE